MRPLVLLVVVAGVALVGAAPAHAHANFERSDPPAGDVLQKSPPALRLWFTEPLEPGFSEVQVLDARGSRVDRRDSRIVPGDRASMVVSLPPLPRGTYSVAWQALSAVDGHVTRGVYSLLIGVAPSVQIAPPPLQIYPTTPYEAVVRWLGYLAVAAIIGAACFIVFVFGPAAGVRPIQASRAAAGATTRIAWAAWWLLIVAAIGSFVVQMVALRDPQQGVASGATAIQLLRTRYGVVLITRVALSTVLGAVLLWVPRRPRLWPIVAAVGSVVLLTTALNSHGAAVQGWLPLISDWIHLIAGAIWVGGLFSLTVFLWRMRRASTSERGDLFARLVPRFSTLAFVCVALLTATGSYLTWVHVGGWLPFLDTLYGRSLAIKLTLVLPLVALGAINLLMIRPKLESVMSGTSVVRLVGWLRRTVTVESALAVLVMLVAAILTSLPPAGQIYPSVAASRPFTMETAARGLQIVLTASPGRPGSNVFVVQLQEGGRPVDAAERVDLRFTFLDQSLGTAIERLRPQGDGRYGVRSAALAIVGLWQIEILVRVPGRDDILTGFRVRAQATGMQVEQARARFRVPGFFTRIADLFRGRRGDVRTLRNPIAPTPEALEIGSKIYQQHCAVCHGTDGSGRGPAAASLKIPPADFRVHMAAGHTDGELFRWVSNGVTGTAMPAFRAKLSEEERWYVITFIRSTFTPTDK